MLRHFPRRLPPPRYGLDTVGADGVRSEGLLRAHLDQALATRNIENG